MRILIIGAGPGGYETAVAAAKRGAEVTIVSDGPVGGTCLNEGCIPTKSFCRNAQVLDDVRQGSAFGVDIPQYSFDFQKVVQRKNQVVEQLRGGVEFLLGGKNITLVRGKAAFKDAHTVVVDGTEYSADYVIIATGSHSATLPIPGNDLPGVITSTEILNLDAVPERLVVIGGGVIGLEFASIFNSFGSSVSVVEFCKEILPRFDTDLAKRLKQSLSKKGISIETSAAVQSIAKAGDGLSVTYVKKDKEFVLEADKVLMAVGRRPNVNTINLDDVGVAYSPKGIQVDGEMRTSVPNIFAIGDVTGGIMLAHAAIFQGLVALDAIFGEKEHDIDLSIIPAAVFTEPEAATVGLTEEECEAKGLKIKCLKSFFRANGKALSMAAPDGFCKLIVSEEDGRLLGCHLFGAHSSDIIQEIAALMNSKATLRDLRSIIHAHPTLTEVLQGAAHSA